MYIKGNQKDNHRFGGSIAISKICETKKKKKKQVPGDLAFRLARLCNEKQTSTVPVGERHWKRLCNKGLARL